MWSDSSRNSIEIASDERRDLARALLECSHRKAHPPRLDPKVCAAWEDETGSEETRWLLNSVRSEHKSRGIDRLFDHRRLALVDLEIDKLAGFGIPPGQFLFPPPS